MAHRAQQRADAVQFARRYVELVNALVKEGVAEMTAREEARLAAIALLVELDGLHMDPCPRCGYDALGNG